MKYKHFIMELEKLIDSGKTLFDAEKLHEDSEFRMWRKRTTKYIDSMERQGYFIDSDIKSRNFGRPRSNYVGMHIDDCIRDYKRELEDTLNELEIIVDDFHNYGVPKKTHQSLAVNDQGLGSDKIPFGWFRSHGQMPLWIFILIVITFSFTVGIRFARSPLYEKLCLNESNVEEIWCDPIRMISSLKP